MPYSRCHLSSPSNSALVNLSQPTRGRRTSLNLLATALPIQPKILATRAQCCLPHGHAAAHQDPEVPLPFATFQQGSPQIPQHPEKHTWATTLMPLDEWGGGGGPQKTPKSHLPPSHPFSIPQCSIQLVEQPRPQDVVKSRI